MRRTTWGASENDRADQVCSILFDPTFSERFQSFHHSRILGAKVRDATDLPVGLFGGGAV
jgi:hypothetical protein